MLLSRPIWYSLVDQKKSDVKVSILLITQLHGVLLGQETSSVCCQSKHWKGSWRFDGRIEGKLAARLLLKYGNGNGYK